MSDQPKLYIAGVGMITPVGFDTASTAAAVRAGVSAYQSTPYYLDEDDVVRMARVPKEALQDSLNEDLLTDEYTARQRRLLRLATLALSQLQPVLPRQQALPLFIAGPEQIIDGDEPITQEFLKSLSQQTDVLLDLSLSRILATGRAGGLASIKLAFRYLADPAYQYVLVGGVDTFYDGRTLQILMENERLLVGGNMDGFIPGEGAAFLLLSNRPHLIGNKTKKTIHVYEPGLATESGCRGSNAPYRGDGLASAVTQALGNANGGGINVLYSSMNGEHFFAKEHGVALTRNRNGFEDNMQVEHPADCFGDLGAAFAPVMLGVSTTDLLETHISSPCMVCCSSDRGPRAAMVLHA